MSSLDKIKTILFGQGEKKESEETPPNPEAVAMSAEQFAKIEDALSAKDDKILQLEQEKKSLEEEKEKGARTIDAMQKQLDTLEEWRKNSLAKDNRKVDTTSTRHIVGKTIGKYQEYANALTDAVKAGGNGDALTMNAVESVTMDDLAPRLKDYAFENRNGIGRRLLLAETVPSYFTTLSGVRDEFELLELITGSVVQPGNKDGFNPVENAVRFKDRKGKVRPMKVDFKLSATRIKALWQSYIGQIDGGKIDAYTIPFESFIFDSIIQQAKNDVRMKALFKGVYNASGTTPADTCNGILTIIKNEITSGKIAAGNLSAGAAITQTNAYDEFQKVVDKVMAATDYSEYLSNGLVMVVSPAVKRAYELDYQATFGSLPYNKEFNKTMIDGVNIEIVSEQSMAGSNRIICTPASNFVWAVNNVSKMEEMTVEKFLRELYMLMDWDCTPEIAVPELVFANNYAGIV